jgi:hypothetical protein
MEKNNWKELEKQEISKLDNTDFDQTSSRIKGDVEGNIGVFKFIGDLIELFIPRIFESIVSALGGAQETQEKK